MFYGTNMSGTWNPEQLAWQWNRGTVLLFHLVNLLQKGGYILYARHGEATVGEDQPDLNFHDCSTQRNLSETGRRQAVMYGEAIRRLRIPVQFPVYASPFCRNRETAAWAFGKENVQVDPFWITIYNLSANLSESEQEWILSSLRSIIETIPPRGSNRIIIGHSFPKGVGLGEIPNMGTVVIKPLGRGRGYEVIAKVSFEEFVEELEWRAGKT
ncbi:MAG TPA: histidine phosphatase family protein [Bacillus sp. (in: firmicutes)]|nr:histidine phosphatase family protein [Bacillus sp. (in: firmicutes)]